MNWEASATAERGQWQFTLTQLFSIATGVALACAAWAPVVHVEMRAISGMTVASRLCGVASVGLIVGALLGRTLRASICALVGLGVAYAACGLIVLWTRQISPRNAGELIGPLLFATLLPAAMAAARNRKLGCVLGVGYVPALLWLIFVSTVFYSNVISPPAPGVPSTAYEGRSWVMVLSLLALVPATIVASCSWLAATMILVGLDTAVNRIRAAANRVTG